MPYIDRYYAMGCEQKDTHGGSFQRELYFKTIILGEIFALKWDSTCGIHSKFMHSNFLKESWHQTGNLNLF